MSNFPFLIKANSAISLVIQGSELKLSLCVAAHLSLKQTPKAVLHMCSIVSSCVHIPTKEVLRQSLHCGQDYSLIYFLKSHCGASLKWTRLLRKLTVKSISMLCLFSSLNGSHVDKCQLAYHKVSLYTMAGLELSVWTGLVSHSQ